MGNQKSSKYHQNVNLVRFLNLKKLKRLLKITITESLIFLVEISSEVEIEDYERKLGIGRRIVAFSF